MMPFSPSVQQNFSPQRRGLKFDLATPGAVDADRWGTGYLCLSRIENKKGDQNDRYPSDPPIKSFTLSFAPRLEFLAVFAGNSNAKQQQTTGRHKKKAGHWVQGMLQSRFWELFAKRFMQPQNNDCYFVKNRPYRTVLTGRTFYRAPFSCLYSSLHICRAIFNLGRNASNLIR